MEKTDAQKAKDLDLLLSTQPVGNLQFLDNATQIGNGYFTTLYIWQYPSETHGLWQKELHNLPGTFVITDIAYQESGVALKKLRLAIREQFGRWQQEREAYERQIAKEEFIELNTIATLLRKNQEVMKFMASRVVVYADTLLDLEKRVADIRKQLEKNEFGSTVLLLEQEYEYQSLFLDHNAQTYLPNKRIGRDVPSSQVKWTFPANHVSLMDPRGMHLGYSLTGGNVCVDVFELDGVARKQYNILVFGEPGGGKSTLIKKILVNQAARGYVLRGFDKSGEYRSVLDYLGASYVSLDGSEGKINIFQIFPTAIHSHTLQVDEQTCLAQQKGKLASWYSILKPKVDDSELDIFESMVTLLYEQFNFIWQGSQSNFTNRSNDAYPTLSDFVELLSKEFHNASYTAAKRQYIEKILWTMEKLKNSYGQLFDGYTTVENVLTEQILFFNIDGLLALESQVIIDAQLFNALNLFWASLINHGKEQSRRYRKREIRFDELLRSMLYIDECHNIINKDNKRASKFVNTMQREGRKLFVGVLLATQSITSIAPEVLEQDVAEILRDIYAFSQYKFFFQIDSSKIEHLRRLTQFDITDNQLSRIATYPQGRCLFSITGAQSFELDVSASNRELELFEGGGRNAED
ncbi:MAG: DUF87 domain-containing protein [Aerococcaceae bacterium]|nr:DUF87 domain-containing protein [Aerococcaceae bacterium]